MVFVNCNSGGDKNGNCPLPNPNENASPEWIFIDTPNEKGELKNIHTNEQFFLSESEKKDRDETIVDNDWVQHDVGGMYDKFYCRGCVSMRIVVTCDNNEDCKNPDYDHENSKANWLIVKEGEAEKVGDNWYCTVCADKAKKQGGGRKRRKQKKNTRRKKKKSKRRKTRGKRKKSKRRKTKHKHIKNRKTKRRTR